MAIKMKRKCKKNEEITMKKAKRWPRKTQGHLFAFYITPRLKITGRKSPDCESRCNSCLTYR